MGDNIATVGPMSAHSDLEMFIWWHFHCKEMPPNGGICKKVHLVAFSMEGDDGIRAVMDHHRVRWWNMRESSLGGVFTGTEGGDGDSFQQKAAAPIGRR